MTHPKDRCTCGQPRSRHKDGTGFCLIRATQCNAFQLGEAHVVLSQSAHCLLNDLVETHEPSGDHPLEVRAELFSNGLIDYHEAGDKPWMHISQRGMAYIKDNEYRPPKEESHD